MSNKPRPDQKTLDSIARLKNTAEFQVYTKFLQERLEYTKSLLVTATPADFQALQGRAMELQDTLKL
jgi:acetone carboxylase gamma subunit